MKTKLNMKECLEAIIAKTQAVDTAFTEAGESLDFTKVKCLGDGDTTAKLERLKALQAEISDLHDDRKEWEGLLKRRKEADEVAGAAGLVLPSEQPQQPRHKSLGELVMEHKGLFMRDGAKAVAIKNNPVLLDIDLKANFFISNPGWVPERPRTDVVTLAATRPLAVVERLPSLPTSTDLVKYMKETTFTNNAAEASEGNAVVESALVLTETSDEVEKVGTFIPVSEEQLEDVPAAQGYLNQRLGFMVLQRLDSQVLEGNGATPNLLGTNSLGGLQTQAKGTDSTPDCIHKGFNLVRTVGFAEPSHLFIHPTDWQDVRLLRTADGIYIFGSPTEAGPERIWGVPVVQTTAVTQNQAYVGDYVMHSCLYLRRGITVEMSSGYDDYFVKGKFAVKATIRCAMVHYRIPAFAKLTGV